MERMHHHVSTGTGRFSRDVSGLQLSGRTETLSLSHGDELDLRIAPVAKKIGDAVVRMPDEGLYWYHPHVREDYTQDMGLYGNIVVEPADPDFWPPVDREVVLMVDDI